MCVKVLINGFGIVNFVVVLCVYPFISILLFMVAQRCVDLLYYLLKLSSSKVGVDEGGGQNIFTAKIMWVKV